MASVYDNENFAGRVNYAATVMLRGGTCTRHFDTCFEMYDGEVVAVALYRRAAKNPKLAAALARYIDAELAAKAAAAYAHIPTRGLAEEARKLRAISQAAFEAQYAEAAAP